MAGTRGWLVLTAPQSQQNTEDAGEDPDTLPKYHWSDAENSAERDSKEV